MVDASGLGPDWSNPVEVQVLSPAPEVTCSEIYVTLKK